MATAFKDVFVKMAELLNEIPHEAIAMAMTESVIKDSVERCLDRRQLWIKVFRQIADDMDTQFSRVRQSRDETVNAIHVIQHDLAKLYDSKLHSVVVDLARLVAILKDLESLCCDKQIVGILSLITGNEIPPTQSSTGQNPPTETATAAATT